MLGDARLVKKWNYGPAIKGRAGTSPARRAC